MPDFFISYNHRDEAWAKWIGATLEAEKYSTVVQAWDMGAGGNFVLEMQKAAAECERTIAVLSPSYLASAFTAPEWAAAFVQDPTGAERKLVPVRVAECEPKGLLKAIVYADLVGLDEAAARHRLLEKVSKAPVPRVGAWPGPGPIATPGPGGSGASFPPPGGGAGAPCRIVLSRHEQDEEAATDLLTHLRPLERRGDVVLWHRGLLKAGQNTSDVVAAQLDAADVVLLFLSADYLADDVTVSEVERAMALRAKVSTRVIPVLFKPAHFAEENFAGLAPLPRDGRPVSTRRDQDQAWFDVASGIKEVVDGFKRDGNRGVAGLATQTPHQPLRAPQQSGGAAGSRTRATVSIGDVTIGNVSGGSTIVIGADNRAPRGRGEDSDGE